MSQGKKFGTFGGVFTPSILTILGVIMYMRLSWVVGNAGLFSAIIIILIAHIVSVTTGLSVSSVATDRKIKAGGIYYMLSRSLGLPIGGSIGITLFVATSLSIALYLIGFAESAMVVLQEPLGIESFGINHIRIVGSLALFVIVTIAYISTSIAIKSQYFILGAIVLSLISIVFGTQVGKEFDLTNTPVTEPGFFVLFGIFFPAVTGFTAGVAMSGDLKDPKKSIPWGTILAVGVGLIVYVLLALFLYYKIDTEILISDKNAIVKFGWIPALVVGGIWGATLSSALGGILGAPRILQAMSVDSITPKIFARGKGVENEPRNALILTFIIAEAGVLIGELDVIAEVVAMFYMAAYLFINLSCLLEQWASPDFRPTFKIPLTNSLIGAIVTFLLMVQLNLVAAIIAILVMIIIFIWLTRKQLVLGSGDVWQSVWSSVVKMGLKNLDKKSTHKRNWNPNILLFSGGTENRSRLIGFSKTIAGKKGIISNFDLIENKTAKLLFPKHKQAIKDDELFSQGIFARRQSCRDNYEGIEAIARTYGFSGVEPNTILMSWEQSSIEPVRFSKLTQKLNDLDYNVLYLDYDKQRGFGDKKTIDIWWTDLSNTTELSLNLAKFINSSLDWRSAEIRILYVNQENDKKVQLEKIIQNLIQGYRLNARPKIINNEIENKDLYEIMKVESYDSDLVIVGVPNNFENEEEFVEKTDELVGILGTTLLLKASSHFEETVVEFEEEIKIEIPEPETVGDTILVMDSSKFYYPFFSNLFVFNNRTSSHLVETVITPVYHQNVLYIDSIKENFIKITEDFFKYYSASNSFSNQTLLVNSYQDFIKTITSKIENYNIQFLPKTEIAFQNALESFLNQNITYQSKLPKKVIRSISLEELKPNPEDSKAEKRAKRYILRKKKNLGIKPKTIIYYREFIQYFYQNYYLKLVNKSLNDVGLFSFKNSKLFTDLVDFVEEEFLELFDSENNKSKYEKIFQNIINKFEDTKKQLNTNYDVIVSGLESRNSNYIYSLSKKIETISITNNLEEKIEIKGTKEFRKQTKMLLAYPAYFTRNSKLFNNSILLDISLHKIRPEIQKILKGVISNINRLSIKPQILQLNQLENINDNSGETNADYKVSILAYLNRLSLVSTDIEGLIDSTIKKVEKTIYTLPSNLDIMDLDSINNFAEIQGNNVKVITIQLQKLILFSVESEMIKTVNKESDKLEDELNGLISDFKNKSKSIELVDFNSENSLVIELREELNKDKIILIDTIETKYQKYVSVLNEVLEETYQLLDYDFISGNIKTIEKYIKRKEINISNFNRVFYKTKKEIRKAVLKTISFVDKQRDEYLLNDFSQKYKSEANVNAIISKFLDKVKMTQEVEEKVPFFYKKMFVGSHASPQVIENRDTEILQAQKAINTLKENRGGAILVLGEELAGKKYFSDFIATRMLDRKTFVIDSIIENKSTQDCFENIVKLTFDSDKKLEEVLDRLPPSTLVFNNLEKWGSDIKVLQKLKEILVRFEMTHYFVLNCNLTFYSYLQQIVDFNEVVVSTIFILPLKKDKFIQYFKLKHQAGGVKFVLNGNKETHLSKKKISFLFQKYHFIYKGNIGLSFLSWVNNISEVNENEIYIKEPKAYFFPDISNPDWIVVLKLFVLFKEISGVQLKTILNENINYITVLNQMKRSKLIEETKTNVFEITDEAKYYVSNYLKDKKVL